ncbi:MAG TPA: hypothetical protein VFY26_18450 [Anaerolineales bacterium]|nr:hypothetical protein [Anaerolineales bacterium]
MVTNRFIRLFIAISVLAVVVLVVREANATASPVANVDSAARSYTAWAKAAEAESSMLDSATRSYIAQAKVAACGVDATYGLSLDSATRSYIAWGFALQANSDIGALCH